jgi:hypothetical protein
LNINNKKSETVCDIRAKDVLFKLAFITDQCDSKMETSDKFQGKPEMLNFKNVTGDFGAKFCHREPDVYL